MNYKKNKKKYNSTKELFRLCVEDKIFLDIKFIDKNGNNISSKNLVNIIIKENNYFDSLMLNDVEHDIADLISVDLKNSSHTLKIYNWHGYNVTTFLLFGLCVESQLDLHDNFDEYYKILDYLYYKYEINFMYKSELDKEWRE